MWGEERSAIGSHKATTRYLWRGTVDGDERIRCVIWQVAVGDPQLSCEHIVQGRLSEGVDSRPAAEDNCGPTDGARRALGEWFLDRPRSHVPYVADIGVHERLHAVDGRDSFELPYGFSWCCPGPQWNT